MTSPSFEPFPGKSVPLRRVCERIYSMSINGCNLVDFAEPHLNEELRVKHGRGRVEWGSWDGLVKSDLAQMEQVC